MIYAISIVNSNLIFILVIFILNLPKSFICTFFKAQSPHGADCLLAGYAWKEF